MRWFEGLVAGSPECSASRASIGPEEGATGSSVNSHGTLTRCRVWPRWTRYLTQAADLPVGSMSSNSVGAP